MYFNITIIKFWLFLIMVISIVSCYRRPLFRFNGCNTGNSFCYSFQMMTTFCEYSMTRTIVPSGLLPIYKPKGWGSTSVVSKIKYLLSEGQKNVTGVKAKIKVGHGGTLDPLAEGVLVLGINHGTKLLNSYLSGSKVYEARALLGSSTTTLDSEGDVTATVDCSCISSTTLNSVLPKYRGTILQIPPMFSALQKDGKRLYDLARQGIEVEREPRKVVVHSLELIEREDFQFPYFGLLIECGGGFYVRSAIDDIAKSCNGLAHMVDLKRLKHGQYTLADCVKEENWNYKALVERIDIY